MSDEKLQLTLWKMPDGSSMVGDQHGREIENVTSLEMSINSHGRRVTVESLDCDVREFDAVQRRALTPVDSIPVEVDGKRVELKELGDNQRVIVFKSDVITPEMIDHFKDQAESTFGKGTIVVCLPKEAEMEIIELPRKEGKPESNMQRPTADWAF